MADLENKNLFTKINVGSGTDLMTMTRWVLAQQQVRYEGEEETLNLLKLSLIFFLLIIFDILVGFC
jgi:hypothetical protein